MNEDNILKNVSIKDPNPDTFIHSFTPMLDTLQHFQKKDNRNDDSTCTRFVRKKFICIIIFLLTLMVCLNFFNTVTEKLSQDDVQQIYKGMSRFMRKMPQLIATKVNSTTFNGTHF
jgi:ABC-type phosphate/phosphonate transport system permease subunit